MIKYADNILTYFENYNSTDVFTKQSAINIGRFIHDGYVYGDVKFADGHLSLKNVVCLSQPYIKVDDETNTLYMTVSISVDDSRFTDEEREELLRGFWRLVMDYEYIEVDGMKEIVVLNNVNIEIGSEEEYNAFINEG